uniref:Large ribosomal subunit protein bL32c n=1 Tax=Stigeoclonium helveticum TaxID=55999 RepID=RK32_STIHE|nr:ribosomal protein L32 [Stigeoclonium helveticum]Q06SF5.1 RecName: Full=Large ribosomal subunit protein bL32c; AltName: Full=50S ribosomal protein L32, chloroplastic [Stigeoclonium helveticum]ABF60186.1 ribosomal protein L32 [Stigeoclonium helveticum]
MAVPKKRTSKSKKNLRKNTWKKKVLKRAMRALFIAKLDLNNLQDNVATLEDSNETSS